MRAICPRHFFRGGESFSRGQSPPLSYGPGHQTFKYADITLYARLVHGYVFRKTSGRFLLDILKSSLVGLDNYAWKFD